MILNFKEILEEVAKHPIQKIAIAAANQMSVIQSAVDAYKKDIAHPIFFGNKPVISEILKNELELNPENFEIIHEEDDLRASRLATTAVRNGDADILMKGNVHTDDFLRAVLDAEQGLRSGVVMSHCFVFEQKSNNRLLIITDGAMNIAPNLVKKAQIILNAVYFAQCLSIEKPKVGVLAATEVVNPDMPATLDAAALSSMERRGQFPTCTVDGPFAFDNAYSLEAAKIKGIDSPIAGDCDILLVPNIEAGNIMVKTFHYMHGGEVAGVLVGASAPVVLSSRADTSESKLYSIATAVIMAGIKRTGRLKIGKIQF
jgi:phosphate butyryltransferase